MSNFSSIEQSSVINVPSIKTDTAALAANPARKAWSIQNVDTDPLFVNLGGTASDTVFHFVLKGSTGAKDGTGGSVSQTSGFVYTGAITIAGTTPNYVVMES